VVHGLRGKERMTNWLEDICTVLRTTKAEQLYGDTVKFRYKHPTVTPKDIDIDGVISYCVLGLLKCNKDPIDTWAKYMDSKHYAYTLELYNVPTEFLEYDREFPTIQNINNLSIDNLMMELNDTHKLSFPEIADFLETTFEDTV